jgi:hypothetical protein
MKSRVLRALLISALLSGVTAGAQTIGHAAPTVAAPGSGATIISGRTVAASDSSHSYDAQALRYETHWGSADIIRGANGPVIGTVGWFRDFDVEKLVASSPQAVIEARAFKTNNFRGSLVGGLGALTLVVGAVITANSSNNAASPILIIAGAGTMAWGAQHLNKGYSALSRALWWYNRDIRDESSPLPAPVTHHSDETKQR